jgi:hypothetical protein
MILRHYCLQAIFEMMPSSCRRDLAPRHMLASSPHVVEFGIATASLFRHAIIDEDDHWPSHREYQGTSYALVIAGEVIVPEYNLWAALVLGLSFAPREWQKNHGLKRAFCAFRKGRDELFNFFQFICAHIAIPVTAE